MKALLKLARIHIEAASRDPDEELALQAMFSDDELRRLLLEVELEDADPGTLSLVGWLWYLRWRRHVGAPSAPANFLSSLFHRYSNAQARLHIVEEACLSSRTPADLPHRILLEEFPDPFFKKELAGLRPDDIENDFARAKEWLVLLLQCTHPLGLAALRGLLSASWRRSAELNRFMSDVLDVSIGDDEARSSWEERLGLRIEER